tara:strand:+ start:1176 stop:1841 length:666 start_codon:yes stop_codon:yes gene_type:complete
MVKLVAHKDGRTLFGKEELVDVAGKKSFAQMIFELLSGNVPSKGELKVFELILNLSIDHGPDTPSSVVTIDKAKQGANISESVAEGIKKIDDTHGGAVEPAMEVLYEVKSEKLEVKSLVEDYLKEDKRLPGFGHRLYKDVDPRAQAILSALNQEKVGADYSTIVKGIERELSNKKGNKLPVNIDGAIAAALCGFGWDPNLGKAVFVIARTSGLCGQFLNNS